MKLYELSNTYSALTDYLNQDDPQDAEALKAQLAQITVAFNEKAENIGKLILSYNAESEAIDNEIIRLTSRKRTLDSHTEWLKDYLKSEMIVAGTEKIQGEILTLSLRKSPMSINILDQNLVPKIFQQGTG